MSTPSLSCYLGGPSEYSPRNSSKLILYDIQLKSGNTRRHPPRQPGSRGPINTTAPPSTTSSIPCLPAMPGLLGGSWWRFTTGAYIAVGCLLMAAHLKNANVLWHNINTEAFLISCVHTLYVINRTKCGQCSWIRQRFTVCESFNLNESDKNSNWDLEFHQSTLSLLFLAQAGRQEYGKVTWSAIKIHPAINHLVSFVWSR